MRVIKKNNVTYESFYRTLPNLDITGKRRIEPVPGHNHKGNLYFNELFRFHNNFNEADEEITLTHLFHESLGRIINFKEAGVFLFNEDQTALIPIDKKNSGYSVNYINNAFGEGTLDEIFQSSKHKIIPDFNLYYTNGSKLNYIVYPIIKKKEKTGLFFLLTSITGLQAGSIDDKYIQVILNAYLAKMEAIKKEEERKKVYEDMSQYQSQLMNNYKYAAVGELTSGITTDVLSSLQIIMSMIDMHGSEGVPLSERDVTSIKNHVNKVEQLIKGVVKFAGSGNENTHLFPCDLNKIIRDYYDLTNSTLKNKNIECVLDLASYLPGIITDPGYINQILTNVFGIIHKSKIESAGILVQTRYLKEKVNLKFLVTETIEEFEGTKTQSPFNIRVLKNLMKLHEGGFKTEISNGNGTMIQFTFPIKRKLK